MYRLDLGFLPKECLYNDLTYDQSNNDLMQAINILEVAQDSKERRSMLTKQRLKANKEKEMLKEKEKEKDKGFFGNFFSVFKCGQNN